MKKQLVSATLFTLIASNIIIGNQYITDSKQYEQKISHQKKIIQTTKRINAEEIRSKAYEIKVLHDQLNKVTQEKAKLSRGGHSPPRMQFIVTAYTAGYESTQKRKGDEGYGITASGTYVKENRTIACPQTLPFGTKLIIQGIGLRTCEDRGSRINENHIDLYVDSLSAAVEFGIKILQVEILN